MQGLGWYRQQPPAICQPAILVLSSGPYLRCHRSSCQPCVDQIDPVVAVALCQPIPVFGKPRQRGELDVVVNSTWW